MELKELVVGAQEAMDGGDFRLALAANTHALMAYPACLVSHRMMGEAFLECGDQGSAVKHFERTLEIDPLNVVAQLGLGVAAEETRNFQAAYAHYLHAWEINPALDQVRDELVRLRGLLNVDDRLHPTRAGLAGIHARAGQFRRAISEWRAVLAAEPESSRGRTALAELLWRGGDDAGAAQAAREALRGSPENARALAILADVERRRDGADADDIAQRLAQVDPTGDMIKVLQPWRTDVDLTYLKVDSAPLDDFDFDANRSRATGPLGARKTVTASLTASQFAAPDLWDSLVHDLTIDIPSTNFAPTLASSVEPFNWNATSTAPEADPVGAQPTAMVDLADQLFGAGDATAPEPASDFESEAGIAVSAERQPAADAAEGVERVNAVATPANTPADMNPESFDGLIRSLVSEEPLEEEHAVVGVAAGMTASAPQADIRPASAQVYALPVSPASISEGSAFIDEPPSLGRGELNGSGDTSPTATKFGGGADGVDFADPFVTADGQIDLTRGWDDLDRALVEATPTFAANENYDALLADLDGIQPFDAAPDGVDEDAWSPLFDDDFAAEPVASTPSVDVPGPVDLDSVPGLDVADWLDDATPEAAALDLPTENEIQPPASIDTYPSVNVPVVETEEPRDATGELLDFADLEAFDVAPELAEAEAPAIEAAIVTGIPVGQPSGYTELLRNVDEETLVVSEESVAEMDPFAIPDGTGHPLDFDELLEVTSSDGTGPLAALDEGGAGAELENPVDLAATDLDSALPPGLEAEFELDGIVPFDSAVFADGDSDDESVEFGEIEGGPPEAVLESAPEFDVEPFAPEIRPFGYTDAPTTFDEEPFDFSDVVVESPTEASDEAAAESAVQPEVEPIAADVESGDEVDAEATAVHAEPERPSWAGKEGLGTVARKVLWPTFVNQTSELIDRALETEDLFERIAAQKEAMIAQGVIVSRERLVPPVVVGAASAPEPAVSHVSGEAASELVSKETAPEMSEQTRLDLMAMRIRVVEDEDAAPEIAKALEQALAEGLSAPLALRVLGEAYLKMGLVERAAALFRQAMLARRRMSQGSR